MKVQTKPLIDERVPQMRNSNKQILKSEPPAKWYSYLPLNEQSFNSVDISSSFRRMMTMIVIALMCSFGFISCSEDDIYTTFDKQVTKLIEKGYVVEYGTYNYPFGKDTINIGTCIVRFNYKPTMDLPLNADELSNHYLFQIFLPSLELYDLKDTGLNSQYLNEFLDNRLKIIYPVIDQGLITVDTNGNVTSPDNNEIKHTIVKYYDLYYLLPIIE